VRALCSLLLVGAGLCAQVPAAPADPAPILDTTADEVILPPLERLQVEALAYVTSQAASLPGHYVFRVMRPPALPRIAGAGRLSFEPDHLSRRDLAGYFFATFRIYSDNRPAGLVRVDLEGQWTGKLLRVVAPLARKCTPQPDQVELVDFEGNPPIGALGVLPEGYQLRAPVATGHFLVQQDLEAIPVVLAGEPVRVELVSGALVISVDAVARTSGALGDRVRLELPTSHKNVQALVIGAGEARVQWAGGN